MESPQFQQFQERITQFQQVAETYAKKHRTLSVIRTVIFIVSTIALVYFANARNLVAILIIVILFIVLFSFLVKRHNSIRFKRRQAQFFVNINEEEVRRLQGQLAAFDGGRRFIKEHHSYIKDLDVFGKNSLFQLLNRCSTEPGKARLGQWLSSAATPHEILLRQTAVEELAPEVDWRQELQAGGKHYEVEAPEKNRDNTDNTEVLLNWVNAPNVIPGKSWYIIASYVMPLLTLALIFLFFFYPISYLFPLAALIINALIMRKISPVAEDTYDKTYKSIQLLKAYLAMIKQVEKKDFGSEKLRSLKESFQHDNFSASHEINKLKTILSRLETRNNGLYVLFNMVFLLDIHFLRQAESWKRKTHSDLSRWFDALSELEALASMAALLFANPEFHLPKLTEKEYCYKAKVLGHPLLSKKVRISNDFALQGKGKIIVLTGSNMSGKSTFLRTLGTNAVLALMGAPVCAENMEIANMQVFTSMRTEDSLEESVSSFYAELKRLRQLLDVVDQGKPVFFMLDEILKGTNSHDRHNGAAALIKQLSELNATGLVSTHDLELGDLAREGANIENFSFTSQVIHDEIIFDYKLHKGICQSFNASKLMEKMGIDMGRVKSGGLGEKNQDRQ